MDIPVIQDKNEIQKAYSKLRTEIAEARLGKLEDISRSLTGKEEYEAKRAISQEYTKQLSQAQKNARNALAYAALPPSALGEVTAPL